MPSIEEVIIERLQNQIGQFAGAMTTKDIQLEVLLNERDEAHAMIVELGGIPPAVQIQKGPNVNGNDQNPGAQSAREAVRASHPSRPQEQESPRQRATGKGSRRQNPDVAD